MENLILKAAVLFIVAVLTFILVRGLLLGRIPRLLNKLSDPVSWSVSRKDKPMAYWINVINYTGALVIFGMVLAWLLFGYVLPGPQTF